MQQPSLFQKFFPASFTLETPRVLLRPMEAGDYDHFLPLTAPKEIWTHFTKDLSDPAELKQWIDDALQDRGQEKRMPFTIIDMDDKKICGSTSFGNISFVDQRIEIGWTWLGTDYMSTGVNRNAKFALLSYAFEVMKMERVELKTGEQNERSKAALLKIGMTPEGVLRSHTNMHGNKRRDNAFFGMLLSEWPEVKKRIFGNMI